MRSHLLWLGLALSASGLSCTKTLPPAPDTVLKAEDFKASADKWSKFLSRYIQVDTTNPPGNEARAFPLLKEGLAQMSLTATITAMGENRGNLWSILKADKPDPGAGPIILLHHIDVVPSELDKWQSNPFSGEIKDGRIYGRGAIDIKLLGALQLGALEYLAKKKDKLRRDMIYLAVSDEEVLGRGAQLAVKENIKDWKPEYLLDEGGFGIRKFMNNRDLLVIATAQKRVARLKMTAKGEAGHGSRPIQTGGPNILTEALSRILDSPAEMQLTPVTQHTFENFGILAGGVKGALLSKLHWPGMLWALEGTLASNKNLNPMLRDTATLTLVNAGQKINVIPAEATAEFDVRLLPHTNYQQFLKRMQTITAGLPVEFEWVTEPLDAAEPSPMDDPLYQALVDATRAHEPQAVVSPWLMVGANDSRFFAPTGIKTYGFNPAFLSKAQVDAIHGHNESIDVDEFAKGLVVYTEALERFLVR